MVALRDMLGASVPHSVRKVARRLSLNKYTVWRWRMLVFSIIGNSPKTGFSGIIETDETDQREARKGSREWVRHLADPRRVAKPQRPRWEDYTTQGLKMMRGLSKWQLPILSVADRGGARLFQRLPDRKSATLERAEEPLVRPTPCCARTAATAIRHWQQGWHSGCRGLLSHPERELAARPLRRVHQALPRSGHEEPQRLHSVAQGAAGGGAAR
jgi:hypothetical protein